MEGGALAELSARTARTGDADCDTDTSGRFCAQAIRLSNAESAEAKKTRERLETVLCFSANFIGLGFNSRVISISAPGGLCAAWDAPSTQFQC